MTASAIAAKATETITDAIKTSGVRWSKDFIRGRHARTRYTLNLDGAGWWQVDAFKAHGGETRVSVELLAAADPTQVLRGLGLVADLLERLKNEGPDLLP